MPQKTTTKTKKTTTRKASKKKTTTEKIKVNGELLLQKVKDLIKEGNVRKIRILDKEDREIIVLPLTVGVVGALLAPPLAAVGAVTALVSECSVLVEREEK